MQGKKNTFFFCHCIASLCDVKSNVKSFLKQNHLRTTYIDAVDSSAHDVRTAGVSQRWYSVNVLFANFQLCCLVCACVYVRKLWFEPDTAEFAAVRMESHRTDEREREGESVKGNAAASSRPGSLWTPVLGVCVCVLRVWRRPWGKTHIPDLSFIQHRQLYRGSAGRVCVLSDSTVMRWRRRRSPGQGRQRETRGSEAPFTMPFFRGNKAISVLIYALLLTVLGAWFVTFGALLCVCMCMCCSL